MSIALESGSQVILLIILGCLLGAKVLRVASDWSFARNKGCGQAKHLPSYVFGLDRLWGFIKAMNTHDSLEFVGNWHQNFGRTFKLRLGRQLVETIEPKNVQAILATQFKDFELGSRNDALKPLLGQGIFASDGAIWEHSRALVRPNFVRNQIADIAVYEKHVSKVIERIPRDGSTVDLQDLFFKMTIDSATEFLFGQSSDTLGIGSGSTTESKSFAENFGISQAGLVVRLRLGPLRGLYKDSAFTKATESSREYVRQLVAGALEDKALRGSGQAKELKSTAEPYVFLHELAKQTQDEKLLTDQLLNILLAGRDTTAGLLSITFLMLSKRQDTWKKLREEVISAVGDRQPSFEDLKSLRYLTWVMNETLRLYPAVPLNARVANKNTTLPTGGGPNGDLPIFVPKGQEVMYSVYSMHRLPEVYGADAAEYRPERWENLRPGWAYLPFNGGPRVCIGQQFALTEAGYTIVRILQAFESIESRDPESFQELLTLTLASNNGAKVALTPVNSEKAA